MSCNKRYGIVPGDVNGYNTRNAETLYVPNSRIIQVKSASGIASIKMNYHLPIFLKNSMEMNDFKN